MDPLAATLWVDPQTTVPVESQTGSISAPFAFIQQALDAFRDAGVTTGTVLCCAGDYGGFSVDWNDPDGEVMVICGVGPQGSVLNVGAISSELEDGTLVLQGLGTFVLPVLAVVLTDTALHVIDCCVSQIVAADSPLTLQRSRFLSDGVQGASIQVTECTFAGAINCAGAVVSTRSTFSGGIVVGSWEAYDCRVEQIVLVASLGAVVVRDCSILAPVSHGDWEAWDCSFLGGLNVEAFVGNGCVLNAVVDGDQLVSSGAVLLDGGRCNMPVAAAAGVELYGTVIGLFGEAVSTVTGLFGVIRGGVLTGDITFTAELRIDSVTNQALLNDGRSVTASPVVIVDTP